MRHLLLPKILAPHPDAAPLWPAAGKRAPSSGFLAGILLMALLLPAPAWAALTLTSVAETESTDLGFKGTAPPNAKVTIRVQNAPLIGGFSEYMTTAKADGTWEFKPPKADRGSFRDKGQIIATSPGCPNATTTLAASFTPGQNFVVTASTVLPGSMATAGGMTFTLAGGFTTIDTDVDYDPVSLTFGDLSLVLLASEFELTGTGEAGVLDISLLADQSFTVNLLPAWTSPDLTGSSIAFNVSMSGIASLNGTDSPFNGTGTGTVTFLQDNQEDIALSIDLDTNFGSVQGSVSALGVAELRVIPEPASLSLLSISILSLAFRRHRHGLAARSRPKAAVECGHMT